MRTLKDKETDEDEKDTKDVAEPAEEAGPVPPKELTLAQLRHLLAEARQIFIDHVTKLGGVGGPLGPIGDRMVAFLVKYDAWTNPTVLPADDTDLDCLPKEEKEKALKERKALREKAAKEAKEPKDDEAPETKKPFATHTRAKDD